MTTQRAAGILALVLGLVGGIGGFLLLAFVRCELEIGAACLATSRPYEIAGIVVMVFAGILIVLGILLLAGIFRAAAPGSTSGGAENEIHGPGRYCPECGARNLPEAAYCASCGTPLPAG